MPTLDAELEATLNAAFVQRMQAISDESATKSHQFQEQADALMKAFTDKFATLLQNPMKIEPINERDGHPATPADSGKAG